MGMDVYGVKPRNKSGEYFRANVWSWHPIADYLTSIAPDLMGTIQYLHTNDGDGLPGEAAIHLADILDAEIESGRTAEYIEAQRLIHEATPSEPCDFCDGTGTRRDAVGVANGFDTRGWCNGCDGTGQVRPFATSYSFTLEHITVFAVFVRNSGGFEIH